MKSILKCRLRLLSCFSLTVVMLTYGYLHVSYSNSTTAGLTEQKTSLILHSWRSNSADSRSTTRHTVGALDPTSQAPAGQRHPATNITHNMTRDYLLTNNMISSSQHSKEGCHGYVLARDYWEQLSSGSRNLQNLQCWAGKIGLRVVEPFAIKSVLQSPLTTPNAMKFRDLFDIESWNGESASLGSSKLYSWETFVSEAPRDMVIVQFKYANSKEITAKRKEVKSNPEGVLARHIRFKEGCSSRAWQQQSHMEEAGFTIIRRVCFNFEYGDRLSWDEFKGEIFGQLNPCSITVYFNQWRGLAEVGRILVRDAGCGNTGIQEHIRPSLRIQTHTRQYIHTHLTNSNNSEYIAIMARLEKSKISFKKRPGIVPYCLEETLKAWREMALKMGFRKTFLAIDIGKYGSNSFKTTGDDSNLGNEFRKFFSALYNNQATVKSWENSFEEVAQTSDSGYIALLQKMIVTQAKCVVFVGGGSFQKHALHLYRSRVPQSQWCIHIVKECTQSKNLPLDS